MAATVFTVGHSTRPIDDFAALLRAHGVECVVDIRTVPKSRHNPQYWEDAMREALPDLGLEYARIAGLGGLRKTVPDSPNGAWRNLSFRGYADHMRTPQDGEDAMRAARPDLGLEHARSAGLGGLRKTVPDSPNGAWRNLSFRGYADYMQTPQFEAALDELLALAAERRLAIMCAEAVPW